MVKVRTIVTIVTTKKVPKKNLYRIEHSERICLQWMLHVSEINKNSKWNKIMRRDIKKVAFLNVEK